MSAESAVLVGAEDTVSSTGNNKLLEVIVIGAGVSALSAVRSLLSALNTDRVGSITIVEASDYVGGRIKSNDSLVPGHQVDLGAEIIHGFGTALTDVIDERREEWQAAIGPEERLLEEIFIAAQGDGGPAEHPTRDGKYGVYYLAEERRLLRFDTDDADFRRMSQVLSNLGSWSDDIDEQDEDGSADGAAVGAGARAGVFAPDTTCEVSETRKIDGAKPNRRRRSSISLGEGLSAVPRRMSGLLEAGYANTAGSTDLNKVSLTATIAYEKHWEENEQEGDARLHPRIGMIGVINALMDEIVADERVSIHLNWEAEIIEWGGSNIVPGKPTGVTVRSTTGRVLHADKVIITAPPPIITSERLKFSPPLPKPKMDAFSMMGLDRAIKVILTFRGRVWPEEIQTVISDSAIPEIWFREFSYAEHDERQTVHAAVSFLTSRAADDFLRAISDKLASLDHQLPLEKRRVELAAGIVKDQLSEIFSVPREEVEAEYLSSIMFDWGDVGTILGGYAYPQVNIEPRHFVDLATNVDGRLYFAGEATNTNAACTVQAAMETGVRAAKDVLAKIE